MSKQGCLDSADLRRLLDVAQGEDDEARLARHLDGCSRCREALSALSQAQAWQPRLPAVPTGEALRRVMQELEALPRRAGRSTRRDADELLLELLAPPAGGERLGRLGPYEVTQVIGRGGMGVVLKAFDPLLHRFVAIKVLAPQLASSRAARSRFAREARAAAAISHEHVVAIHGVDEANGLPYLVMEYVAGISLQERLDRNGPLELMEILRIGLQVASGLAAAHAQGLVHRDVKPANILLESGMARVKITDFGLARLADDASSVSQSGGLAGTPPYMAPEQARGEGVDHRADLFSLGSVLYAMCTGSPPFLGSSTLGILRRVSEDEPIPVREWNPAIPEWLAAVIATLHTREPAGRFSSAREVADLLGAYLAHLQQPARVPPPAVPRRPGPARQRSLGWVLLLVLVACAAVLALTALHFLPPAGPARQAPPRLRAHLAGPHPALCGAAFTPGSEVLATAGDDGAVTLWDLATSSPRAVLPGHGSRAWCVAFSPDGKLLASAAGAWSDPPEPGQVKLWDAVTGQHLHTLRGDAGLVFSVAFSPGGTVLASGGWDGHVRLWDVQTGNLLALLQGHAGPVRSVAFAPDGRTLASGSFDCSVRLWDVEARQLRRIVDCGAGKVNAVSFSPDGRRLATAENPVGPASSSPGPRQGVVRLRDARTGAVKKTLSGLRGLVLSLAFAPDGRALATGGGRWRDFGEVALWDIASARETVYLHGHREWVECVAFSPDGGLLVSAGGTSGSRGEMKLWDLRPGAGSPGAIELRWPPVPLPQRSVP